jgi:hypothetical protein
LSHGNPRWIVITPELRKKSADSRKAMVRPVDDSIVDYAMELDIYGVQSYARAHDYAKTFIRANALLNGKTKVTRSDLYLYDLIHPMLLNSMGEMGMENRILALLKSNPNASDNELIKKSGIARGTFYKYKRILREKGVI